MGQLTEARGTRRTRAPKASGEAHRRRTHEKQVSSAGDASSIGQLVLTRGDLTGSVDLRAILEALACGRPRCPCGQAATRGHGNTHCPAHEDRTPSLAVTKKGPQILVHCHAGCEQAEVIAALDQLGLWRSGHSSRKGNLARTGRAAHPSVGPAIAQSSGLTVADYAQAKALPAEVLREMGVTDYRHGGRPAVRIAYRDIHGAERSVRFRIALSGSDRFRWRTGDKILPYGLDRLSDARAREHLTLCEGESDAQTLWIHGEPALGIPGANTWTDEWAAELAGIQTIYLVVEPDQGGDTLRETLAASPLADRVRLIELNPYKDVSALYLSAPADFSLVWNQAKASSVSLTDMGRAETERTRAEDWQRCAELAGDPRILDRLQDAVTDDGVVGEERAIKVLYLALTSRVLARPVSVAVKGPSSGGKSFLVNEVLSFFPPDAVQVLSAMSERALAYSTVPLKHRFLVLYEAAGLQGDFASYLVRSLLSEGHLRYETVEKTDHGLQAREIHREGPTGLIVTTTAVSLHPENETRLLSLLVTDTNQQTRAIMRAQAQGASQDRLCGDHESWHAFQRWVATGPSEVDIRYAPQLAEAIPAVATRLRRDFPALLGLVGAHALLHQASRERNTEGRVIATPEDYAVVRGLVADIVSDGLGATVPPTIRETVEAVEAVLEHGASEVSVAAVRQRLGGLDHSTAWRRVREGIGRGYFAEPRNTARASCASAPRRSTPG
jgi:hypothetical protein